MENAQLHRLVGSHTPPSLRDSSSSINGLRLSIARANSRSAFGLHHWSPSLGEDKTAPPLRGGVCVLYYIRSVKKQGISGKR